MQYFLKEKIGNSELYTGRKREMVDILKWIEKIKPELSMSMAILSRRKTGKTSFLQRLYNIIFHKNDGVIPFYYEIIESDQYIIEFSKQFFLTFIYQYIAFKTRKIKYLNYSIQDYSLAIQSAKNEGQNHLIPFITDIRLAEKNESHGIIWDIARDAPRKICLVHDERVVQMIDEFQYLNRKIYLDKTKTHLIKDLAASYLHTAEYKNAPLLIAGSWIGWLMSDVNSMLPGRFIYFPFKNLTKEESIEMIHRYSDIEQISISEQSAFLISELSEGNPFYISSFFRSQFPDKNLTTKEGVIQTLEYEILDQNGIIRNTWSEYLNYALSTVNNIHAKRIVLYLCKNKNRRIPRYELKKELNLKMTDQDLEKKMNSLIMSDIINSGGSRYKYQAIQDNVFEKVFMAEFGGDIESFDPEHDIAVSYKKLMNAFEKKFKKIQGKLNRTKGVYAEYALIDLIKYHAFKSKYNKRIQSMFVNLPNSFEFVQYERVWTYTASPLHKKNIQIDIFAKAKPEFYSIIGEVKKRKSPFTVKEAKIFLEKANSLKSIEHIKKAILMIYCEGGFYKNTVQFMKKHDMSWCDDENLLSVID